MIDPNELRLGSYISFKGLWNGFVAKVGEASIGIKDNEGFFDDECMQPVPLSQQILLQLGFVETLEVPTGYWKTLAHYRLGKFCLYFEGEFRLNGIYNVPTVKSVHQLQNLYFALTGTELTVNLDKANLK